MRKWKLIMILSTVCLLVGCGPKNTETTGEFAIDDVFTITGRGTVVTGTVESGVICVGDRAVVVKEDGTEMETEIVALEQFRNLLEEAKEGDVVGIQIEGVEKADVSRGDTLVVYGD